MYEQTSLIGPQTAEAPAVRYYEINERRPATLTTAPT